MRDRRHTAATAENIREIHRIFDFRKVKLGTLGGLVRGYKYVTQHRHKGASQNEWPARGMLAWDVEGISACSVRYDWTLSCVTVSGEVSKLLCDATYFARPLLRIES